MMKLTIVFLVIVLTLGAYQKTWASKEATMEPLIIFSEYSKNINFNTPYAHPHFPDAPADEDTIVSVQEGNLVRVAVYCNMGEQVSRGKIYYFQNDTGRNLQGLPAALKYEVNSVPGARKKKIFFGDITLPIAALPTKPIGTEEWPNNMRWKRIWKNYYHVTLYRYDSIIADDLCCLIGKTRVSTGGDEGPFIRKYIDSSLRADDPKRLIDRDDPRRFMGQDAPELLAVIGDSIEHPGKRPFAASFTGGIDIVPLILRGEKPREYILNSVTEKDLPPDFPKGLVKFIP